MKRINNIYHKINDIDVIMDMYNNVVSKNTKNKNKIERFNDYYSSNIINIKNMIESKDYKPGKYHVFFIREPKLRIIMSQTITDKIINHLVAKYFLVNIFDKVFIDSNVATRIGRGTHYGLRLTKKYLIEMKNRNGSNFYYLKFDISKYFYNLNHYIVKKLIRRKIKDKDALKIIDRIIDSTDEVYINKEINELKNREIERIRGLCINNSLKNKMIDEVISIPIYQKGVGFPIGNMTSQIIAILYLNELDHFIKEELKIKYYVRYMDDGILIHEDKEYLKYCKEEIEKLLQKYQLEFNYNKTRIDSIKTGIDFLGYHFYVKNCIIMKVRNLTKKRFKRKMRYLNLKYYNGIIKYDKLRCVRDSYAGHLRYGNCGSLIYTNLQK